MSENLAILVETLHLGELHEVRTEVPVVNFYIDILAKDGNGGSVLFENQLGPTNHKHLGQIMTYLAGQEAGVTVIWIAEAFGDAHRAAVDWLNANTSEGFNFFGVEIEAWKIGSSAPAPRFNVVAKPNSWSRGVTQATKPDSDAQGQYAAYWTAFDTFVKEQSPSAPFTVAIPPITWACRFPRRNTRSCPCCIGREREQSGRG